MGRGPGVSRGLFDLAVAGRVARRYAPTEKVIAASVLFLPFDATM